MKKPATTGLNFILRKGWWLKDISTPWGDPDGLRRATLDNIKWSAGMASWTLISIQSVRHLWLDRWSRQYYES